MKTQVRILVAFPRNPFQLLPEQGTDGERKDKLRSKPLSGTLYITLKGADELDHAPVVSRARASSRVIETTVSIKVEGTQLARSHPSRTGRWNEDFEIPVEKANEIEIVIYDKQVSEPHAIPIGLLWIRINDLVDALRRQKLATDANGGWVTAGALPGDSPPGMAGYNPAGGGDFNSALGGYSGGPGGQSSAFSGPSEGIEARFAVEPIGTITLRLNFGKILFVLESMC